jgi:hypothetical protein
MKWRLSLLVVGLMLSGCNAKLKRHVGSIEDMSVKVRHQQVRPGVDLAEMDGTETDEYAAEKGDPSHPASHGAIEAFEQGFGMRLSSVMDTQKMAKRVGKTARASFEKGKPFELNPKSDWNMELMITEWGVGSGFSGAAQAEMRVYAVMFSPSGERVWHKSVGCTWDLAPTLRWDVGQVTANLATLSAMRDTVIRTTYMDLAAACGRALSNTFRVDVGRARKKAKRK